jgi:PAS domain S-box-containing protein
MTHRQVSSARHDPASLRDRVRRSADHAVQFYESETYLATAVAAFLADGFRDGNAMVVVATPEHHEAFAAYLEEQGFDVSAAVASKQYNYFDALQMLESFMDGAIPNAGRFNESIGTIIENCRGGRDCLPVLAFGEMTDILWRDGRHDAAIELEQLWTKLISRFGVQLLCGYSIKTFEQSSESLAQRSIALEAEISRRQHVEKDLAHALQEQQDLAHRLNQTEHELHAVLDGAVEGLHWVAQDGEILWANQAELDILGYNADEYVGRNIREFHADAKVIEDILIQLSNGETLRNQEARLLHKDGSIRNVLINANALWENGEFVHTQCFTRDITELKIAENFHPFYRSIIESAEDAIVSKTLNGIVTSWNPGAERIFGYTAEEMIGRPIAILIPEERPDEEPRILERLCRGERIAHYETIRVRKDGKRIHISLMVSPVKDRYGRIIGASKIARDITARKRIEAELNQLLNKEQAARSQAESASRLKDEFLAVLSHELRTPLNAIIGWTHILATRDEREMIERAVDVIQRNALVQKRLVEDLLDMSRILSGKLVIRTDQVNLREVVMAAIDSVRPAAAAKKISVDVQIDPAIQSITGDADRLQQVVWNLLSNSVKFTPPAGRIVVRARAKPSVEIEVEDTGKGIARDFLPFVFDRFRQAEQGTSRQHGGLGLGLAVARHLIELHGGTIEVDSLGEGLGATFKVCLPT